MAETHAPDYAADPAAFIDRFLPLNELGKRWELSAHQRRVMAIAFTSETAARFTLRLLLWSEPKKSGKTMLAACFAIWWAMSRGPTGVRCLANDFDQAQGRVFATVVALLKVNGFERAKLVKLLASEVRFQNGSIIRAAASDATGEAGARDTLNVFDELHAYSSERAMRLWEECTPIPTAPEAWNLVVTYAGFSGESTLLETLYRRGLDGERLDEELEVYRAAGGMLMFWSHTPRQPWQTPEYYAEQQASLRPSAFARLHRNEWVSSEGTFITSDMWDACVEESARAVLSWPGAVFVGVDAGIKSDNAAVVAIGWDAGCLRLLSHRLWKPKADAPIDLEATIQAHLRELNHCFNLAAVRYDPWQLHALMTRLRVEGLPIVEYAQTEAHTGEMGSALYDLLRRRNIVLYPDDELRQQALNAAAIENARGGFRLAKLKSSRKIDAIVALAMACTAALEQGEEMPLMLIGGSHYREWARSHGIPEGDAEPRRERPSIVRQALERAAESWSAITARRRAVEEVIAEPEPQSRPPRLVDVAKAVLRGDEHDAHRAGVAWAAHQREQEEQRQQWERQERAAKWLAERVRRNGSWFPSDF